MHIINLSKNHKFQNIQTISKIFIIKITSVIFSVLNNIFHFFTCKNPLDKTLAILDPKIYIHMGWGSIKIIPPPLLSRRYRDAHKSNVHNIVVVFS